MLWLFVYVCVSVLCSFIGVRKIRLENKINVEVNGKISVVRNGYQYS